MKTANVILERWIRRARSLSSNAPIIILGTGRCGSTFVQSLLSSIEDIWIWGEHDGMLAKLTAWSEFTRSSDLLNRFGYVNVGRDPVQVLKENPTHAAWVTSFEPSDIQRLERGLIQDLFSLRLPHGKYRWGFKEIRYGGSDGVPERMLELFPECRIIHLVREPTKTVVSSLSAWHIDILRSEDTKSGADLLLEAQAEFHFGRWVDVNGHLRDLSVSYPRNFFRLRLESIEPALPELFDFLGVNPASFIGFGDGERNQTAISKEEEDVIINVTRRVFDRDKTIASLASGFGY